MEFMAVSKSANIEYDLSIVVLPYDVPVQLVHSKVIRIICPQAAVHFCVQPVLQPQAEHGLVLWCVEILAVRCKMCLTDSGLGYYVQ
jgi:hypothetical protein